jgi:hypothetical protein
MSQVKLDNYKGITSDDVANTCMTERLSRVIKRLYETTNNFAAFNHCFIHHEDLTSKVIPCNLTDALNKTINIFNLIKIN